MAEETKCIVMQLRPRFKELRDKRTYTEVQVKRILFSFARDLEIDWPDEELWDFIETAFNFD